MSEIQHSQIQKESIPMTYNMRVYIMTVESTTHLRQNSVCVCARACICILVHIFYILKVNKLIARE